ncbi:MAG: hypothetical protein CMI54_02890 [Parcubacteria group bacterium]|nr:hypothetical protein [Parcubacteria group bacterium]|tara:strand:- start:11260 stop:11493 length:234 start_codon:yes stop_codon:yes gene_type:complete
MNGVGNGFFKKMCKEATEELASGKKGWKEADTNTLLLACFGILSNHLTQKLSRPLWFFASSIAVGVISYIVIKMFGI